MDTSDSGCATRTMPCTESEPTACNAARHPGLASSCKLQSRLFYLTNTDNLCYSVQLLVPTDSKIFCLDLLQFISKPAVHILASFPSQPHFYSLLATHTLSSTTAYPQTNSWKLWLALPWKQMYFLQCGHSKCDLLIWCLDCLQCCDRSDWCQTKIKKNQAMNLIPLIKIRKCWNDNIDIKPRFWQL